jgi:hypothetical protein
MKNINLYFWILLILFILSLGFLLYKIKYCNAYIGINMKPCSFCKDFKGKHMHFIGENSYKNYPNYANNHLLCNYCKNHPGKIHIHNNL